jgi:phosphoribosylglycinamide formyltransferase-1
VRLAVLASGRGSNARRLIDEAQRASNGVRVLITDRADAGALTHAQDAGVPAETVDPSGGRDAFETRLLERLSAHNVNWLLLAGFMRVLSPRVVQAFHDPALGHARILNIHPSLLPAYPGLNAYERAWQDGVQEHGVTVHVVDDGVDTGPIVAQASYRREPGDTLDAFTARGLALEHDLYARTLQRLLNGTLTA